MTEAEVASPFPPRVSAAIRADSVAEEYAYVAAWPPPGGPWQRVSQLLAFATSGPEDHLTLRSPDGATVVLRVAIGSFFGRPQESDEAPGEWVTAAMRAGHELARQEGPLHPGTLPLYPVPSPAHAGAVAVPLAIVALDAGRRGLYAPPRIAVVRWPSGAGVGVGDAPGFDPARWPPPFLGEWPPNAVREWDRSRLAGAVERFSAIWGRLLDAWFSGQSYSERDDERYEARLLLQRLMPPRLRDVYRELSPDYCNWLGISEESPSPAAVGRVPSGRRWG